VTPFKSRVSALDRARLPEPFLDDDVLEQLTVEEARALAAIVEGWVQPTTARPTPGYRKPPAAAPDANGSLTRLPRPVSIAWLRDVAVLSGCKPKSTQVALVEVGYRPTGQVSAVTPIATRIPPECERAAAVVAALEVAPGEAQVPAQRSDRLVIGLRPSDFECERSSGQAQPPTVRVGDRIKTPKKSRNVQPVYRSDLVQSGVQGTVMAEATISTGGCLADAFITHRVHPVLDVAALTAVSGWRYEPAILDGAAVPVIMTVFVNFNLQ
jgi:TonB family protein